VIRGGRPGLRRRRSRLLAGSVAVAATLSLSAGASEARPAKVSDAVTISMLINNTPKAAFDVLIPNFERVYPNIKVDVTYTELVTVLFQLETIQLAAGNAPDLLSVFPGCGSPLSICVLAKAGYLAPMVKKPWAKRSLPLVTSLNKYGQGLFAFSPQVTPWGIFTNDDLFSKLGLKIPQTFSQLLGVCQKAKAAGTVALIVTGGSAVQVSFLIENLAVATLYGKDKQWAGELKAGKVTFDGTQAWHAALQEFIDMNNAGCFQPGVTGTTIDSAHAQFAQGQSLMLAGPSQSKGSIDAGNPRFRYSHHPFPGGTDPNQTRSFIAPSTSLGVNAHSSAQNQAAAQTFIDFIARPKQNALYAHTLGGLTQYEFLKGQIPAFMSDFATVFKEHRYVIVPQVSWWNAKVLLALQDNQIGLITGQRSIDDVLNAMDAAWKQGPT
jgi:raffinose/stachyose/melibiose transport system substrate-binding protein